MQRDYIPYDLAAMLKLLKFNEKCSAYYDYWVDSNGKDRFTFRSGEVSGATEHITPVPTYSQAIRWFRETYQADLSIARCSTPQIIDDETVYPKTYTSYIIDDIANTYLEVEEFGCYEDAQREGLAQLIRTYLKRLYL